MEILKVRSYEDFIVWYRSQAYPQETQVELDCQKETLRVSYNPFVGGGCTPEVWFEHTLLFPIVPNTLDKINELLDVLTPLAQTVIDGYSSEWDGRNMVAKFNDEADDACRKINALCKEFVEDSTGSFGVVRAGDWFNASDIELSADTSDEDLEALADKLFTEALSDGVYLYGVLAELDTIQVKLLTKES